MPIFLKPWRQHPVGSARWSRRRQTVSQGRIWRSLGSTLVQALIAVSVSIFAALFLASRLMASRMNSANQSNVLTAREAAEYGLNELQETLNSNQRGYLWVTKLSNWGTISLTTLASCRVYAVDDTGSPLSSLPTLPAGVTTSKEISNAGGKRISYQLTSYDPPALLDDNSKTIAQTGFCSDATSAANFGNLNGGSVSLTVRGEVNDNGRVSRFSLRRKTHVFPPGDKLGYSFVILGDAHLASGTSTPAFGSNSDISEFNILQGDICYGAPTDANCQGKPKAIIGCFDLGSCLINNVDSVSTLQRAAYCANVTPGSKGKKKRAGFTCNDFQQVNVNWPSIPTPNSEGVFNASNPSTAYTSSDWNTSLSATISCSVQEFTVGSGPAATIETDWGCKSSSSLSPGSAMRVRFPYVYNSSTSLLSNKNQIFSNNLANKDLVPGCYFNGVSAKSNTQANSSKTTAINCLIRDLDIDNSVNSKAFKQSSCDPSLIVFTTSMPTATCSQMMDKNTLSTDLLPVNLFFYGTYGASGNLEQNIFLNKGGIKNSNISESGWINLKLLGKPTATTSGNSVPCNSSSKIISTSQNDLQNVFIWLPNTALEYDRIDSRDNAYMVAWTCRFIAPVNSSKNKSYSIVLPVPEDVVRQQLITNFGSQFAGQGRVYRSFGYQDQPVSN